MKAPALTLSVVSHAQGELVDLLLGDLARFVSTPLRVVLTLNMREPEERWVNRDFPFPIEIIRNASPKGFGANHNAALTRATTEFFCVINPDIRLSDDPFQALIKEIANSRIGVIAPSVTRPDLVAEDHARNFPSIFTLAAKVTGHRPRVTPPPGQKLYFPDWVAGMFMLFRSEILRSVGGFDERYFLYYEDVDLCARLRERGFEVAVCPATSVIHAARRESRRNIRYASWHLRSAIRFLWTRPGIAFGMKRRP